MAKVPYRKIKKFDFAPIGEEIKRVRMERNMTREELAEELSLSVGHLANIENKGTSPGFQLLHRMVKYLNISVDQFFFPSTDLEKGIKLQVVNLVEECDNRDLYIVRNILRGIHESKKGKVTTLHPKER